MSDLQPHVFFQRFSVWIKKLEKYFVGWLLWMRTLRLTEIVHFALWCLDGWDVNATHDLLLNVNVSRLIFRKFGCFLVIYWDFSHKNSGKMNLIHRDRENHSQKWNPRLGLSETDKYLLPVCFAKELIFQCRQLSGLKVLHSFFRKRTSAAREKDVLTSKSKFRTIEENANNFRHFGKLENERTLPKLMAHWKLVKAWQLSIGPNYVFFCYSLYS